MKTLKKSLCALLAVLMLAASLTACGGAKEVNTKTGSFDDMVAYLTGKGYIAKDAVPVDMLTTEGYITDNTGGEIPFAPFADKAQDFGGLWLMWWDSATPSAAYTDCFQNIAMNGGTIVYMGGACVLQTEAYSGNFAIAFAKGYEKADAALADFKALPNE